MSGSAPRASHSTSQWFSRKPHDVERMAPIFPDRHPAMAEGFSSLPMATPSISSCWSPHLSQRSFHSHHGLRQESLGARCPFRVCLETQLPKSQRVLFREHCLEVMVFRVQSPLTAEVSFEVRAWPSLSQDGRSGVRTCVHHLRGEGP